MPYITGVEIAGFQSHTGSRFNLVQGLNVITGPSDSGKTAIIRAVRWVAFGEPGGDAFVNKKSQEAIVRITLDSGMVVTKRRKGKKTSYSLQANEAVEGQLFEKAEVPEEIRIALGIEKQTFGDFTTALNFAFQLEAPFLISETASAGAKILGKLAGTEDVDTAIKDVSKDTYQARQLRSQAEKEISEINVQLLEFEGIERTREQLETVEYLVQETEKEVVRLDFLKEQSRKIATLEESVNVLKTRLETLVYVNILEEELKNIEKVQQRYDTLLDLLRILDKTTATVDTLTQQLVSYNDLDTIVNVLNTLAYSQERFNLLLSLSSLYTKYTAEENNYLLQLVRLEGVPTAGNIINSLQGTAERVNKLKAIEPDHRNTKDKINALTSAIDKLQGLEELQIVLSTLTVQENEIEAFRTLRNDYDVSKENISKADYRLQNTHTEVKHTQTELSKAWEAAGGICPLCEQAHKGDGC